MQFMQIWFIYMQVSKLHILQKLRLCLYHHLYAFYRQVSLFNQELYFEAFDLYHDNHYGINVFKHISEPWCSIVGATVTVHQFFCILHWSWWIKKN